MLAYSCYRAWLEHVVELINDSLCYLSAVREMITHVNPNQDDRYDFENIHV